MNQILFFFDKPGLRYLLYPLIYINYVRKGEKIKKVTYNSQYKLWCYTVGRFSFFSSSPGWVYSFNYLFRILKQISCYAYLPQKGDIVLDVGAGLGEETLIMADLVGNNGKVFSIEANPRVFSALEYIVKNNGLTNVLLFNNALSDKNEMISIEDSVESADSFLANSVNNTRNSQNKMNVQALTLDSFIEGNKIEKIDLLRVNIEGAEQLMIKGMESGIEKIKNIAISCHDFRYHAGESDFFKTKEKIIDYFSSKGFLITTQNTSDTVIDDYVYGIRL
jgi:FkbM family methyltransferase